MENSKSQTFLKKQRKNPNLPKQSQTLNDKPIAKNKSTSKNVEATEVAISSDKQERKDPVIKLTLGSYEGKVMCLDYNLATSKLKTFSFKASENCIKTIINSEKHIFVTGNDEIIHLYDIENKEEKGLVLTYNGSISKVVKFKDFLFVGGDAHSIGLWRMTDFSNISALKGHKGSITDFILHRNGKLLLSVSKDNYLMLWNTTDFKPLLKYNLKKLCNKLIFGKKQLSAFLVFDNEIWQIKLNNQTNDFKDWILKQEKFTSKIIDCQFVKGYLLIFFQKGEVRIFPDFSGENTSYDIVLETPVVKENEEVRVKIVNVLTHNKYKILIVVYSNNDIYLFDLVKVLKNIEKKQSGCVEKFRVIQLATHERITCVNSFIESDEGDEEEEKGNEGDN